MKSFQFRSKNTSYHENLRNKLPSFTCILVGDCWILIFCVNRVALWRWDGLCKWTTPLLPCISFVTMLVPKSLGWRLICCWPFLPCCTCMCTVVGWRFKFPNCFLCFWFCIPCVAITPDFCGRVVANLTIFRIMLHSQHTINNIAIENLWIEEFTLFPVSEIEKILWFIKQELTKWPIHMKILLFSMTL